MSVHKALDGALKQVKSLSPETSAIFFSVDSEANKVVVLAATPKVISENYRDSRFDTCNLNALYFRAQTIVASKLTSGLLTSARYLMVKAAGVQVRPNLLVTILLVLLKQ